MKRNYFTKMGKALVALCMVLCITVGASGVAEAAGWTSLAVSSSKTMKCYTLANANETTYTSSALTTKKGTVYPTDEITIVKIGTYKDSSKTVDYALIHYSTSSGTKEAYIALNKLSKAGYGAFTEMKATAKIENVYRRASSTRYGTSYISKGDLVYKSVTSGDYTQVIYPVSSGWKMAFIKTTDANKYLTKVGDTPSTNLSYGLYKNTNARISCGFDGYVNTSGRHEGIDIVCGVGSPVYSLTSGVVTRITKGATGSGGLSTIAIYNSAADKTVIYLHSEPLSLTVGQNISKGQQIAKESWRGCSSSSGAHTHVEVRNGKQTAACKSVGDPVLENSNPTTFWNSQGYIIK